MENIISTRSAKPQDLHILLEFEQGIIEAERPFDETLKQENINYYDLLELILSDDVEVVVAEINSEIVGSGYAKIVKAKQYLDHEYYAYLGFMFTHKNHRGKNVNTHIIEALKKWCISKNILELRLDVYDTNMAAIRAYEKVGFKKNIVNMRIRLKLMD
jgi:GNAT superfamily N-acetyltransferase